MDINVLTFILCISLIYIFGRFFILPLKYIFKLIINSFLGALLLYLINIFGASFNFYVGINIWTSMAVGFLGVPGAVCIVVLKLLLA